MEFFKLTKNFQDAEDGAVTVDWVVLTAAVVGLGVAALTAVRSGTENLSSRIGGFLETQSVGQ